MIRIILGILFYLLSSLVYAIGTIPPDTIITEPYKGTFYAPEHGVTIVMNLYNEDVVIPGYAILGPTNGYMKGNTNQHLYGIWILTSFELNSDNVLLRFSNDLGSESQTVSFRIQKDGFYKYRTIGGNEVKKIVGKKFIKTASEMIFELKR